MDTGNIEERIMVIIDDKSTSNEKEIIWVDKEWKEIIEKMCSTRAVQKQVVRSVAEFKNEVDINLEWADDAVSSFKKKMEAIREEMKLMYQAEYELNEQAYNDLSGLRKKIYEKTEAIRKEIREGARVELKALSEELGQFRLYGLEKLIELLEKFSQMDPKNKELFSYALQKYSESK